MKRLVIDSTPVETMTDDVLVTQAMEIGRHHEFESFPLDEIAQLFKKNPSHGLLVLLTVLCKDTAYLHHPSSSQYLKLHSSQRIFLIDTTKPEVNKAE